MIFLVPKLSSAYITFGCCCYCTVAIWVLLSLLSGTETVNRGVTMGIGVTREGRVCRNKDGKKVVTV